MPDEYGCPTYDEWFNGLSEVDRARTQALTESLRGAGAHEPEEWARSEVSENIAQAARYSFLRALWRQLERWRDEAFVAQQLAGVSEDQRQVVAKLVTKVAFEATFDAVMVVDHEEDIDSPVPLPGWRLVELDADGQPTGRDVLGLHESILEVDPLGIEAEDIRGW